MSSGSNAFTTASLPATLPGTRSSTGSFLAETATSMLAMPPRSTLAAIPTATNNSSLTSADGSSSNSSTPFPLIVVVIAGSVVLVFVVVLTVVCVRKRKAKGLDREGGSLGGGRGGMAEMGSSTAMGTGKRQVSQASLTHMRPDEPPSDFDDVAPGEGAGAGGMAEKMDMMLGAGAGGSLSLSRQPSLARAGSISISRAGSITAPSTPTPSVLDSFYSPPPLPRSRSQSFSNVGGGDMGGGVPSLGRRPSLPGSQNPSLPSEIELVSAYKDSDLAERAFQMQRQHQLVMQQRAMMTAGAGAMAAGASTPAGSMLALPNRAAGMPEHHLSRRPSLASTTGSLGRGLGGGMDDDYSVTGAADLDSFSINFESQRWVFARRASNTGIDPVLVATMVGGNPHIVGGGWGVMTELRDGGPVEIPGVLQSAQPSAAATLDPANGRVMLIDSDRMGTSEADNPTSGMMDMLNGGGNGGGGARRPSIRTGGLGSAGGSNSGGSIVGGPSSKRRSVRDQVRLSMSWRETSLQQHRSYAASVASGYGGAVGGGGPTSPKRSAGAPLLRPNPLRPLIASGERRDAWPTFIHTLSQTLAGLAEYDEAYRTTGGNPTRSGTPQSPNPSSLASPRLLIPPPPLPDKLNDLVQELCVTVASLTRTATSIPARIGYEPRAFNEVALRRHDAVVLWHVFDDDFGYGVNRTTGCVGFINLGHLDPKRLANAFEPAPLPLPMPAIPAHLRSPHPPTPSLAPGSVVVSGPNSAGAPVNARLSIQSQGSNASPSTLGSSLGRNPTSGASGGAGLQITAN
ncbi:hypothetical protein HK101_004862, partial [Irineochytrium annulatum]